MREPPRANSSIAEWVEFYRAAGVNIIPLRFRSKAPNLSSWTEYQQRRATSEEIQEWLERGLFGNVGILCGFGGLSIVDVEDQQSYEKLFTKEERDDLPNRTWVVRTGGGGLHVYFYNDRPLKTLREHNNVIQVDLQGAGAYCLGPPSIHPDTGARYEFLSRSGNPIARINNLERFLSERLRQLGLERNDRRMWRNVENTAEGSRDDSLFRYGCHLRYCVGKSPEIILQEMRRANSTFRPPLGDDEVGKCWRNAMSYGGKDLGEKEIT